MSPAMVDTRFDGLNSPHTSGFSNGQPLIGGIGSDWVWQTTVFTPRKLTEVMRTAG